MRKVVMLALMTLAIALAPVFSQPVFAQTRSAPKPGSTSTATMDNVSKWTRKQWNAAKAKWSQEKTKWAGCQKQASDKKLAGRKSWSFLYSCMTT